jgi:hypothetical protein
MGNETLLTKEKSKLRTVFYVSNSLSCVCKLILLNTESQHLTKITYQHDGLSTVDVALLSCRTSCYVAKIVEPVCHDMRKPHNQCYEIYGRICTLHYSTSLKPNPLPDN